MIDSAGGTPTAATGTIALPVKPLMIGARRTGLILLPWSDAFWQDWPMIHLKSCGLR
jgi:hypothetical protein